MDDEDVKIDLEYFRHLLDAEVGNFLLKFAPDKDSRQAMGKLLACCNRHGVSSMQVMKILFDLVQEITSQ